MSEPTPMLRRGGIGPVNDKIDVDAVDDARKTSVQFVADLLHIGRNAHRRPICQTVVDAQAWISSDNYALACQQVETEHWPAGERIVRMEISKLVGAFPNAPNADLRPFGALLVEDVISKNPSRYAIAAACRKLRQTRKFLPAISEVLEAIEDAERTINYARKSLEELPARIRDASAELG